MLDKITKSCRYVANNSKYVKINEDKLTEFISTMKDLKTVHWLNYVPYNILDLPVETIINFLLIYDSINFLFGEIQDGRLIQKKEKKMVQLHFYMPCLNM